MLTKIRLVRRAILGICRLVVLRLSNPSIKVGKGFFCASGCRISTGRTVTIGDNFYMGYGCHLGANMMVGNDVLAYVVIGRSHRL